MAQNTRKNREVSLTDKIHRKSFSNPDSMHPQLCFSTARKDSGCTNQHCSLTMAQFLQLHDPKRSWIPLCTLNTQPQNNDAQLTIKIIPNNAICTELLHFIDTKTYPAEHFPAHTRPKSIDEQPDLGHRRRWEANDKWSLFCSTGRAWNHFSTPLANFYWEIYIQVLSQVFKELSRVSWVKTICVNKEESPELLSDSFWLSQNQRNPSQLPFHHPLQMSNLPLPSFSSLSASPSCRLSPFPPAARKRTAK